MNKQTIHENQPIVTRGPALKDAAGTIIMIHGRGGAPEGILPLYDVLEAPQFAAIAPQAAGGTLYPHSFLAPIASNQPSLDSALARIEGLVADLLARDIPSDRIALLGFSQRACLASEFVARHPRRYGAVMALSGGLIGPPGTLRNYAGSLAGTPVLLASSDPDAHVPFARVEESQDVLARMGALVDIRRYLNYPHSINEDEIQACRDLLRDIIAR